MPTYNLSPLEATGGFPDPHRQGTWFSSPGTLAELARRLRTPDGGKVQDAKSVPDVWAQPRTFADALLQEGHPLSASAIEQWRALMALFALEGEMALRYRLGLRPIVLQANGPRLDRVLLALPPASSLGQLAIEPKARATWVAPYLVSLETVRSSGGGVRLSHDRPRIIGMMNPNCLVSPGRDCGREPIPGIPWMSGDEWIDPLKLTGDGALSNGEQKALQEFLYHVIDGVQATKQGSEDDSTAAALIGRLNEFAEDCTGAQRSPFKARITPTAADEQAPHLYRLMRASVVVEEDASVDPALISECRVSLRQDLAGPRPFKGLILVDVGIAETLGKTPKDVLVWRTRNLASLSSNDAEFADAKREAAEAGYLMIRPSSLFTDKFLKLGRKAIIEGHQGTFRDALLPVSPLTLLLMRPDQLAASMDSRTEGAGREAVSLRITLDPVTLPTGLIGKPVEHRVRKVYSDNPTTDRGELVEEAVWTYGGVAVWPNVTSTQWNWYFARLTYNLKQASSVRGRLVTSGASLAEYLEPMDSAQKDAEVGALSSPTAIQSEVNPLSGTSYSAPWLERVKLSDDPVPEELQSSKHPFEAVFFTYAANETELPTPAGMALLKYGRSPEMTRTPGTVAVDFGTTNTVACFDDNERVVFKNRLLHPISSGDSNWLNAVMPYLHWPFVEFMPLGERTTPTPTVMLDRSVGTGGAPAVARGEDKRLLHSSVMYFQPDLELRDDTEDLEKFRSILSRVRFNLKWDQLPVVRIASHRFLRQLVMMTSLEALASGRNPDLLRWRFSRPDAMRDSNSEFTDTVTQQLREIRPEAASELTSFYGKPTSQIFPLCSEGKAAANFVISGGVNNAFVPGTVNVILDIGGGTTDVAIWANNAPVWRGSYRLAGQDFFTAHMVRNPDLLRRLGLAAWATILQPVSDGDRLDSDQLPYVGELLFSGPVLERAMEEHWLENSGTPECRSLIQTSQVFLGGIAWYLGLVVKGLIDRGQIAPDLMQSTTFALCGRGSGIFKRLHGMGGDGEESAVSTLLQLFREASGVEGPTPRLSVSTTPKMEVVNGMVLKNSALDLDAPDEASHEYEPAGLDVPFGGGTLSSGNDIIDDLPSGAVRRPDMAAFNEFIAALGERTRTRIDINEAGDQSASANISTKIFNKLMKDKGEVHEPPFITALRALLDDVTTPGHNGRLRISLDPAPSRREKSRTRKDA